MLLGYLYLIELDGTRFSDLWCGIIYRNHANPNMIFLEPFLMTLECCSIQVDWQMRNEANVNERCRYPYRFNFN